MSDNIDIKSLRTAWESTMYMRFFCHEDIFILSNTFKMILHISKSFKEQANITDEEETIFFDSIKKFKLTEGHINTYEVIIEELIPYSDKSDIDFLYSGLNDYKNKIKSKLRDNKINNILKNK